MLVVLLLGIPGSGKSSFSRFLMRHYRNEYGRCVHIVSFDAIGEDIEWNEHSFKKIRTKALGDISLKLSNWSSGEDDACEEYPDILIIDDIMHLRSMRREVYVIARDNSMPVLLVHMNTSTETAVQRNASRTAAARIPEEIVRKIARELEPPDSSLIFDRNFLTISEEEDPERSVLEVSRHVQILWRKHCAVIQTKPYSAISSIDTSGSSPVHKTYGKILDEMIRNVVSSSMKECSTFMRTNCQQADASSSFLLQEFGKACAASKAYILQLARRRHPVEIGVGSFLLIFKAQVVEFMHSEISGPLESMGGSLALQLRSEFLEIIGRIVSSALVKLDSCAMIDDA